MLQEIMNNEIFLWFHPIELSKVAREERRERENKNKFQLHKGKIETNEEEIERKMTFERMKE